MERAFFALRGFASTIASFKVRKTLAIATSALRDAPNRNIFVNRIRRELGINIKVIAGDREALLGGVACANLLDSTERSTTIDIGGGSTEFALIENRKVIATYSLDLGTVRLKELFDGERRDIEGAKRYISKVLSELPEEFYQRRVVGIGGSIRALSKVIQKRNSYPISKIHNYSYPYSGQNRQFLKSVIGATNSQLKSFGIKQERVDVLPWGTLIFTEVLNSFRVDEVVSSGVGIREGLLLTDILRNSNLKFPENFNPSLRTLIDQFPTKYGYSSNITELSKQIFDLTAERFGLSNSFRKLLIIASKLIGVGSEADYYGKTKNGFYLIQNRLIYQLSHQDTTLIAFLVRYNGKWNISSKKRAYSEFEELLPSMEKLITLNSILSLSTAFLSHYPKKRDISVDFDGEKLSLKVESEYIKYFIEERTREYNPDDFLSLSIEVDSEF
jgi:exopolyphosphatase/guanosine-5'-triphosphate,3'-diphosphate pyrophosphatase